MRPSTDLHLIDLLRRSGYAGHGIDGLNSFYQIDRRMRDRHVGKCQVGQFALDAVKEAMDMVYQAKWLGPPMVLDKSAAPGEPAMLVRTSFEHSQPAGTMAQRNRRGCADVFDEHKFVFSKYQELNIRTGSQILDQFRP